MRYRLIISLLTIAAFCSAQGFRTRHYAPGSLNSIARAIFETTPGNYIAGGFAMDSASNQLCIMGLNAQGQVQWRKKYGNNKFEYLNNSFIMRSYYKSGNCLYYTGCVRDSNNKQIGVLIRFNLNGDTAWQKIYRDPLCDVIPQMVTKSVDGGFLLTGFFQDWTNHTNPCLLIKTDASGNELWRKKINKGSPNEQDGKAIVQDSTSKKIVIVGYQYVGNSNSASVCDNVLVLDSLGTKLNQSLFTSSGGSLYDVIQTKDKKLVAVGYRNYNQTLGGSNLMASFAVKFDVDTPLTPIWLINGFDKMTLENGFACIKELPNEDLLFSGIIDTMQMHNMNSNSLNRYTKMNKNGHIIWNKYYDYKTNDTLSYNIQGTRSMELTSDGGWITAIEISNFPTPNPFFFVKYDGNGCDSTLAYCAEQAAVGIQQYNLTNYNVHVYPNPTQGFLNIDTENTDSEKNLSAAFFDVYGREVKRVQLDELSTGIDLRELSGGLYLIKINDSSGCMVYQAKVLKLDD